MRIGVIKRGYFKLPPNHTKGQLNHLHFRRWFDVMIKYLEVLGHEVVTIGMIENSGADRGFLARRDFPEEKGRYRSRLQRLVTESIYDFPDEIFYGLDFIVTSFYSWMYERATSYSILYAAADAGVPVVLWDTDLAFHFDVGDKRADQMDCVQDAAKWVLQKETYVNPTLIDPTIIDDLRMVVLTPAMIRPSWQFFFPYFRYGPIRPLKFNEKAVDLIFCGNQLKRGDVLLRYFDVPETRYSVDVYGKYKKDFVASFEHPDCNFCGYVPAIEVSGLLSTGLCSLSVQNPKYWDRGAISVRPYEIIEAGTLLLVDDSVGLPHKLVGAEFVVSGPYDIEPFVRATKRQVADWRQMQLESEMMRDSDPLLRAAELVEIARSELL